MPIVDALIIRVLEMELGCLVFGNGQSDFHNRTVGRFVGTLCCKIEDLLYFRYAHNVQL
jgi:hypothetical protein